MYHVISVLLNNPSTHTYILHVLMYTNFSLYTPLFIYALTFIRFYILHILIQTHVYAFVHSQGETHKHTQISAMSANINNYFLQRKLFLHSITISTSLWLYFALEWSQKGLTFAGLCKNQEYSNQNMIKIHPKHYGSSSLGDDPLGILCCRDSSCHPN